ncbi:hypothetical protein EGR_00269 [Echinococcus granulosus]|uniref:Uncharacterized protein n=1 Tax=Echinococcus granulosus TaxID=6210 RepID=W6UTN8_ECHGR|nr:hypothetical protein EGR_00269 [Echinococcus granulosus]EUB65000.1 hypothetical protein EGR_00269 [Echinococcus granulosus]
MKAATSVDVLLLPTDYCLERCGFFRVAREKSLMTKWRCRKQEQSCCTSVTMYKGEGEGLEDGGLKDVRCQNNSNKVAAMVDENLSEIFNVIFGSTTAGELRNLCSLGFIIGVWIFLMANCWKNCKNHWNLNRVLFIENALNVKNKSSTHIEISFNHSNAAILELANQYIQCGSIGYAGGEMFNLLNNLTDHCIQIEGNISSGPPYCAENVVESFSSGMYTEDLFILVGGVLQDAVTSLPLFELLTFSDI